MRFLPIRKPLFWIICIVALKLILTFVFVANRQGEYNLALIYTGDSKDYISYATRLAGGDVSAAPDRAPVYPVFLFLMFFLSGGNNPIAIVLVQHILYAIALLYFFRTGSLLFGERIGLFSMLMIAADPLYFIFSFRYSTENMAILFSIIMLYHFCLLMKEEKRRTRHMILGGLFMGLTILSRPVYALFPFIFSLLILLFLRSPLPVRFRIAFLSGFFSYSLLLIWALINLFIWNSFNISGNESSKKRYLSAFYYQCIGTGEPYSREKSDRYLYGMFDDFEKKQGRSPDFHEKIALQSEFSRKVEKEYWYLYLAIPVKFSYKFFQPATQYYYAFTGKEEPADHVNVTTNSEHLEKSFFRTLWDKLSRDPIVLIYGSYHILFILFILSGVIAASVRLIRKRSDQFLVVMAALIFIYTTYLSAPFIQARYRIVFSMVFILLAAYGWQRLIPASKNKNHALQ